MLVSSGMKHRTWRMPRGGTVSTFGGKEIPRVCYLSTAAGCSTDTSDRELRIVQTKSFRNAVQTQSDSLARRTLYSADAPQYSQESCTLLPSEPQIQSPHLLLQLPPRLSSLPSYCIDLPNPSFVPTTFLWSLGLAAASYKKLIGSLLSFMKSPLNPR